MDFHEAANIFPIDDEHVDELADDIRKNGQAVEIEILDGKVLDGRRRWLACLKAEIKPKTRVVKIDDPVAHVLSLNLHRRHLAPAQLAMVGARARDLYDKQAKERQKLAKGQGIKGPVNLPDVKGDARDAVGKAVGVSGKTIDHATRVLEKGTPELVKAVDDGRMAVSTAALLATEPAEKQIEEINQPKRNRRYLPGQGNIGDGRQKDTDSEPERDIESNGKIKGVGVFRANEAIDCLKRIPKNDALRKRGFQIVSDWIKENK